MYTCTYIYIYIIYIHVCIHIILIVCVCRLEAIAEDAELQEKSLTDLESLADALHEGCHEAVLQHQSMFVLYAHCLL